MTNQELANVVAFELDMEIQTFNSLNYEFNFERLLEIRELGEFNLPDLKYFIEREALNMSLQVNTDIQNINSLARFYDLSMSYNSLCKLNSNLRYF